MKPSATVILLMLFNSCHVNYSFSGGQTGDATSFVVHNITNQAPLVVPVLSQSFTETLKQKFLNGTNLSLVESSGDLEFSGTITNYQVAPLAAQANETAALNRLTISVNIEFINHKDETKSWTSSFSQYTDYDSNKDLSSVQNQLIDEINDQLVEDIFNKAVVNW